MKQILCYGDSNTWGANPGQNGRLPFQERWAGRIETHFSGEIRVCEEGLCGRTAAVSDPLMPGRNGAKFLPTCLETHMPLDMIIILLGTNDLKKRFHLTAREISLEIELLLKIIRNWSPADSTQPPILVVSPTLVRKEILTSRFADSFGLQAVEKSHELFPNYQTICQQYGCRCLNGADYAEASLNDSIHLDAENHAKLADALIHEISKIL